MRSGSLMMTIVRARRGHAQADPRAAVVRGFDAQFAVEAFGRRVRERHAEAESLLLARLERPRRIARKSAAEIADGKFDHIRIARGAETDFVATGFRGRVGG